MAKDNHRKHQQLNQELVILNTRIRAYEKRMAKGRGKTPQGEWERWVRELKKLGERKAALHRKIRELG